ncbi:hypothetical protein [Pseudarthrobacter sp. H2]|uniref:hypothetical protein n=1 Tax=Pseudarthrobacter sp. H2 TaxID=3418415 RepID=UPI003CEB866D
MSSYDPPAGSTPGSPAPLQPEAQDPEAPKGQMQAGQVQAQQVQDGVRLPARVGTVVWGLVVLALAALIIIAGLGIVALDGTYVLIGLMIGAGAALVVGGLLSARGRDKEPTRGKS